jgi:hypothetical protein
MDAARAWACRRRTVPTGAVVFRLSPLTDRPVPRALHHGLIPCCSPSMKQKNISPLPAPRSPIHFLRFALPPLRSPSALLCLQPPWVSVLVCHRRPRAVLQPRATNCQASPDALSHRLPLTTPRDPCRGTAPTILWPDRHFRELRRNAVYLVDPNTGFRG